MEKINNKTIAVVGPTHLKNGSKNIGGVSEFTENIAESLNNYYPTQLVTNFCDNDFFRNKIKINHVNIKKKYSLISLFKIYFLLKKMHPDIVISSLQYSFPVVFLAGAYKIHFVHGFESKKYYSFFKRLIFKLLNYLVKKRFDLVLCNSNFTKMINDILLNNHIDGVIPLAVNKIYLTENSKNAGRDIDFLYVGRIEKAKELDKLINAVDLLQKDVTVYIVGSGSYLSTLKKSALNKRLKIHFVGEKNDEDVKQIYQRSKIFISLNSHEPFGITFIEALASGCEIIAPNTGGQVENLLNFPERTFFLKNMSIRNIADTMEKSLKNYVSISNMSKKDKLYYSYDRVAKDIMSYINK